MLERERDIMDGFSNNFLDKKELDAKDWLGRQDTSDIEEFLGRWKSWEYFGSYKAWIEAELKRRSNKDQNKEKRIGLFYGGIVVIITGVCVSVVSLFLIEYLNK